ncbi:MULTISPECIES: hypothetical protein [Streptomyces]|uniref:Uncharacterized protein n=1 Tax=Streptomyces silvae TaxID=2803812 RepID=A0ABU8AD91_9ACTN|nr:MULTISPECIES: hypothetical protein [unclassified Streptomyces]WSS73180.1 hypothetical protein OG491_35170 [Streptomyces sp. NBC_01175]WSS80212.1 hypothetical protein OG414_35690 [Streptomyces sp. NBC_01174]MDX3327476.1 hypothetical protein [Streptomyces sp. ME02-6979-3A]MDX3434293.1 hypothetical protein [Streptomyces sp. ME01-18a]MDX3685847.1 hypothetical protein [Streptomyces sp. AK04-4c]
MPPPEARTRAPIRSSSASRPRTRADAVGGFIECPPTAIRPSGTGRTPFSGAWAARRRSQKNSPSDTMARAPNTDHARRVFSAHFGGCAVT